MAKGNGGLFHDSKVTGSGDGRSSAPQNTSVGSGSQPTKSRYPLHTSEPTNHHTLDRNPKNPLK